MICFLVCTVSVCSLYNSRRSFQQQQQQRLILRTWPHFSQQQKKQPSRWWLLTLYLSSSPSPTCLLLTLLLSLSSSLQLVDCCVVAFILVTVLFKPLQGLKACWWWQNHSCFFPWNFTRVWVETLQQVPSVLTLGVCFRFCTQSSHDCCLLFSLCTLLLFPTYLIFRKKFPVGLEVT